MSNTTIFVMTFVVIVLIMFALWLKVRQEEEQYIAYLKRTDPHLHAAYLERKRKNAEAAKRPPQSTPPMKPPFKVVVSTILSDKDEVVYCDTQHEARNTVGLIRTIFHEGAIKSIRIERANVTP